MTSLVSSCQSVSDKVGLWGGLVEISRQNKLFGYSWSGVDSHWREWRGWNQCTVDISPQGEEHAGEMLIPSRLIYLGHLREQLNQGLIQALNTLIVLRLIKWGNNPLNIVAGPVVVQGIRYHLGPTICDEAFGIYKEGDDLNSDEPWYVFSSMFFDDPCHGPEFSVINDHEKGLFSALSLRNWSQSVKGPLLKGARPSIRSTNLGGLRLAAFISQNINLQDLSMSQQRWGHRTLSFTI